MNVTAGTFFMSGIKNTLAPNLQQANVRRYIHKCNHKASTAKFSAVLQKTSFVANFQS